MSFHEIYSKYADFERLKLHQSENYLPVKWINDIGQILTKTDIAVCRAGINTLTELAYFGIPAITIPIPNHSEQNLNAKYFEKAGLVKILPQSRLTPQTLLESLKIIKRRAKVTNNFIIKDAAKRVALETILAGLHE